MLLKRSLLFPNWNQLKSPVFDGIIRRATLFFCLIQQRHSIQIKVLQNIGLCLVRISFIPMDLRVQCKINCQFRNAYKRNVCKTVGFHECRVSVFRGRETYIHMNSNLSPLKLNVDNNNNDNSYMCKALNTTYILLTRVQELIVNPRTKVHALRSLWSVLTRRHVTSTIANPRWRAHKKINVLPKGIPFLSMSSPFHYS